MNMNSRIQFIAPLVAIVLMLIAATDVTAQTRNREADRELRFAFNVLQNDMPASAADHFQAFIGNYPNHPEMGSALYGLARAYDQMGDREAITWYGKYLDQFPRGEYVKEAMYGLAYSRYQHEQWQEAREAFRAYFDRYPDARDASSARFLEATALVRQGRYDDAIAIFAQIEREPGNPYAMEAAYSIGTANFRARRYAQAAESLERTLQKYPGTDVASKAAGLLGDIYYRENEFGKARHYYSQALESDLGHGDEIYFWRAFSLIKGGDTKAGLVELLALPEKFPESERSFEALRYVISIGEASGATQLAESALQRMKQLQNLSEAEAREARYRTGLDLYYEGEFAAATKELLPLAAAENPYREDALYLLGIVAMKNNDYSEADLYFQSAQDSTADPALREKIILARIDLYHQSGNLEKISALTDQLKTNDSQPLVGAWITSAELREASGDLAGAIQDYQKVVDNFPATVEAASALYSLGIARYGSANYDSSITMFERFLDHPKSTGRLAEFRDDAWFWIGFSRFQKGEMESAIAAFEEAASISKGDKRLSALLRAGDAAFGINDYEAALGFYDRVLEEGASLDLQTRRDALFNRAAALRNMGRLDAAVAGYMKVYEEGGSDFEDALFDVGELLQAAERPEDAAAHYEKYLGLVADTGHREEMAFRAANLRAELGDTERAVAHYQTVIALDRALAPDALYSLGVLRVREGKLPAARENFDRALREYPQTYHGRLSALELADIEPDPARANTILEALLADVSDDAISARAKVRLSEMAQERNDTEAAMSLSQEALFALPDGPSLARAKLVYGSVLFGEQRYPEARRQLEYLWLSPEYDNSLYQKQAGEILVDLHLAADRKKDALRLTHELTDRYPETQSRMESVRAEIE